MAEFFHEIFQQCREQSKLSVAKLAAKSGVPANTIKGWIKRNSVPRHSDQVVYIAAALEVDEVTANRLLRASNHATISGLMEETKHRVRQARLNNQQDERQLEIDQNEKLQQTLKQWIKRPASPERFPHISEDFIGREEEISHFEKALRENRYIVISGPFGVGKTWLATRIALKNNSTEGIFWHECYEDHDQARIIMHMAEFLAWRGEPQFWNLLHERMERGELPDTSLLNSILALLSELQVILCFKNFHDIAEDSKQKELVDKLIKTARSRNIRLIVTARREIILERGVRFKPLKGLNEEDARIYLHTQLSPQRTPAIRESIFQRLYQSTEGNVQLLALAAQILRNNPQPQNLLKRLIEDEQVDRFLIEEVHKVIGENEQLVMESISIFLEHPATSDAIEEVTEGKKIRQTLRGLTKRYLLQKAFDEQSTVTTYQQMPILREFYYSYLGKRERRMLHQRAAEYYHHEEIDYLKAALHYYHADKHETAARLATHDTLHYIYQGLSETVRRLLLQIHPQQLQTEQQAQIGISLGHIYDFREEPTKAEEHYLAALDILKAQPDSDVSLAQKAQIYRGLVILLRTRNVEQAYYWVEEGLQTVATVSPVDEADLLIQRGIIRRRKSNDDLVFQSFEIALQLLESIPLTAQTRNRIEGLQFLAQNNLAIHFFHKSMIEASLGWLERAYETSQKLRDPYKQLSINMNLAALYQVSGRWAEAIPQYQAAIAQADKLGKVLEQSRVYGNAGALYKQLGDFSEAESYLLQALELGRNADQHDTILNAQVHLAHVYLLQGNLSNMERLLDEAESLANQTDIHYQLPMIYRLRAECLATLEDWQNAQQMAQQALSAADDLGIQDDAGPAQRLLAVILHRLGDAKEAFENFEQSLHVLQDNPYEAALTKAEWGRCLIEQNEIEDGSQILQEAYDMLEQLDAKYDMQKYLRFLN